MEAYSPRNCNDEAIIKLVGKLTLKFPQFFEDLATQRELKATLDEALYGYDIMSQCKELIVSDIEEKMQIYIACRRLEGLSEKTLSNYQGIIIKLAQFFHKPLSSITAMDIRMWLAVYKNNGIKESTINSKIFCLNKFFTWLVDEEYLAKNIMHKIKVVKLPKLKPKVMSTEQEELLRENCKNIRERSIIELALSSGLRVSEVANLKLSNINFNTREITLIGKGSKERTTYFSIKAKMLLENYLKERKEFKHHENVFLSEKFPHQPIKSRALQLILDKIKARAGLENVEFITFHNLRKKCFTDGLSRGLTIAQVQAMAGHSDPSTTIQSYIQINEENTRHDYNKANL